MSLRVKYQNTVEEENPFRHREELVEPAAAAPSNEPQRELIEKKRLEPIPIGPNGIEISNSEQAGRFAQLIYKSKLLPPSFRTPEQVIIAIFRAIELKLPILQSLEGMSVIGNKVGLMGDLALSLVESSGLLEDKSVKYEGEGDTLTCILTIQRKGRKAHEYSFSVAEAKQAGIYERSSVWKSYPRRMVYYRALGFALRDEFSDVLKGVRTSEELADYPNE